MRHASQCDLAWLSAYNERVVTKSKYGPESSLGQNVENLTFQAKKFGPDFIGNWITIEGF